MTNQDESAPASKLDIKLLMDQIGTFFDQAQVKLAELEERMGARAMEQEERLTRHINVVAENMVHDFKGAFRDKLAQHEDRLHRLEHNASLTSA